MTEQLTVWGVGTTRTMRVHWMLHELGLDYRTHRIESRTGETSQAGYAKLNPRRKIPTLVHGDLVLTESYAIIRYLRSLSDALPRDDYQQSARGLAHHDEWASFILMELDATSLYVVRRHGDLPEVYGEAPAAIDSSIAYFRRMLDAVDDRFGDGPLWGSAFSEIDILMTVALDWAAAIGIELPDRACAWQAVMRQRAPYQAALRHNFRDLQIPVGR